MAAMSMVQCSRLSVAVILLACTMAVGAMLMAVAATHMACSWRWQHCPWHAHVDGGDAHGMLMTEW